MTPPRPRPSITGGGNASGPDAALRFMNRAVSVYRGSAVNAWGDKSDVGALYLTNVQAAIAETSDTVFDPATQRPSVIRAVKCIVPGWADIRTTDTIQDSFTGWYYLVTSIEQEPGLGCRPPRQILTLRLRSGVNVEGETGSS